MIKKYKFFIVFSGIIFLFLSAVAFADSQLIKSVKCSGNKRTPDDTIQNVIHTTVGSTLNLEAVDQDVKSLYALSQFRDIRVETVPVSGGVDVIYYFEENPLISDISFSGNKKIKSDDLKGEVTQHTFATLDEHAVAESMEKIRAAYAKKGYYLAKVDYHIETNDQGEPKLVFDIHENEGVIVRKVLFIGNKVFKDKELRGQVRTREKTLFSFLTGTGKYQEEMLRADMMMLTYFYLNHGYLKVKVSPPRVTISKDKRYIYVTFHVYEGSQYKIGKVTLSGDILTTHDELAGLLKTKKGNIYSQQTLDSDRDTLADRYGDEGYAFASIDPQVIPDDETLTAEVAVNIVKGKKITIERINIIGNTTTRDKVIRREIELKEHDRYSVRLLNRSKERLRAIGFFEEVNFATPRGSRDDTVVLNVTVKEKSTGSFNVSAGFSTFDHFIFNASVQKENFFGYGVGGSISAELSRKRQLFMLSANDPYFLDSEWSAGFSVYRSGFSYNDFKRDSTGGDINLGHRLFDYFSVQLGYQVEEVKATDFSYIVPQVFRQDASGLTSALSLTLARDTRDNRIYPKKGLMTSVLQEVSGAKLGGNNDFYRVNARNMFYYPVWKGIVFKQFARVGYIKNLSSKGVVPLYERFFVGGANSLRGFNPNTVGPALQIPVAPTGPLQNFVYGGNKLLLFLTELEVPIYDKAGIRGVAFFDAGNSYSENQNYSFTNMRLDYGLGLRWNSPMGPLRFEFGFPIQRRTGEDSMVFNFTIGNFF